MNETVRLRVLGVLNMVGAVALGYWLLSGKSRASDGSGPLSWISYGLVVLLIAAGVTAFLRSRR
ncbi:MAG TPA: hypothetical protein VF441_05640 [Acidimicrobiia bacterium]